MHGRSLEGTRTCKRCCWHFLNPVLDTNFLTSLPFGQPVWFFFFFFGVPPSKDLLSIKSQRRLVKMSILLINERGCDESYNKLLSQ